MGWFNESDQFKSGREVERWLDAFLSQRGWLIKRATGHEEQVLKLGDRQISRGEHVYWVEYKSGKQTFYTGNIFLETVSNDRLGKPGWVYTLKADYLLWACVLHTPPFVLVFKPETLRSEIADLKSRFREAGNGRGQNPTYRSWGVLVPLAEAQALAVQTLM